MEQKKLSIHREAALRDFARRLKADAEARAEEALAAWEEALAQGGAALAAFEEGVLACASWNEDPEDPAAKVP